MTALPSLSPKSRNRAVAWLAAFVLLLQALVPSLAAAVSAAGGRTVVEICSTQGTRQVVVDATGSPVEPPAIGRDCPCCLAGSCSALSLPAATVAGGLPVAVESSTAISRAATRPHGLPADALRVWLSRLRDGPPDFS